MPASRDALIARLRERRVEIEQALRARSMSVPSNAISDDPEYRQGFRLAVAAGFAYSLSVMELGGDDHPPPVPAEILAQARLAARHRIGLDAVLRGYVAGSSSLDDFILDECERDDVQPLLRSRAVALEHLLSRVSDEYESERLSRDSSRESRSFERVRRLLRGEPDSRGDLGYRLSSNHVGLVARGTDPKQMLGALAAPLDSHLLAVSADPETAWAWLGRRGSLHAERVQEVIEAAKPPGVSVGIGEPAAGLSGWRLTHRQARAALPVALNSATHLARYADVCLIASAMQDPLLTTSLEELYLQPLRAARDGGEVHLRTLRAYFAADCNGKSTAAALGVSRQAVASRLRVVEERLGRPLPSCAAAMEVAVSLPDTERLSPLPSSTGESAL